MVEELDALWEEDAKQGMGMDGDAVCGLRWSVATSKLQAGARDKEKDDVLLSADARL